MNDYEFKEGRESGGYLDHPILEKHINLLKRLSVDSRVLIVGKNDDNGFFIGECCDGWYSHKLTKDECIELSELFRELADETKEDENE